jgi:two-component system response regulator LytT
MSGLSVLAVDDEEPALDELRYLLRSSPHVSGLSLAQSATEALMRLQEGGIDVVLLDIRMPGLDGMDLARVLARFSAPPAVIFVTAHEAHALEAFDVGTC